MTTERALVKHEITKNHPMFIQSLSYTYQNNIMKYHLFKDLLNNNNIIIKNICTSVGCNKVNDIVDLVKKP